MPVGGGRGAALTCALLAQEAAQVHAGAHAALRRPLHRLHGHAVHRGLRGALASPDALRDAVQLLPGAGRPGGRGCLLLTAGLALASASLLPTGIFCRHHLLFLQWRGKRWAKRWASAGKAGRTKRPQGSGALLLPCSCPVLPLFLQERPEGREVFPVAQAQAQDVLGFVGSPISGVAQCLPSPRAEFSVIQIKRLSHPRGHLSLRGSGYVSCLQPDTESWALELSGNLEFTRLPPGLCCRGRGGGTAGLGVTGGRGVRGAPEAHLLLPPRSKLRSGSRGAAGRSPWISSARHAAGAAATATVRWCLTRA